MPQHPMRHLLALIEAPDHVGYRYRLAAYGSVLADEGWSLEPLVIDRGPASCLEQLERAAAADAVILQRRLLPWWRLWLLRRAAKRLIFDLDDAVFFRDSNTWKSAYSSRRLWRFQNTVRQVDAITAGNNFLLDEAATRGAGQRVHHFPTCVEPRLYVPAQHFRRGTQCRLVWIGSRGTATSLLAAGPILAAVARRLPNIELRMICDWFPKLSGVRVTPQAWSSHTEAQELADADIGISWLPEHPWSLGKCGLKVLQYMAAGLPVVANPIGIHRQLVQHGRTGYLASTPEQWADAILRLSSSPELRAAMGRAGREHVAEHFSAHRWAKRFAGMLDSLVEARQPSITPLATEPLPAVGHVSSGRTKRRGAAGRAERSHRPATVEPTGQPPRSGVNLAPPAELLTDVPLLGSERHGG